MQTPRSRSQPFFTSLLRRQKGFVSSIRPKLTVPMEHKRGYEDSPDVLFHSVSTTPRTHRNRRPSAQDLTIHGLRSSSTSLHGMFLVRSTRAVCRRDPDDDEIVGPHVLLERGKPRPTRKCKAGIFLQENSEVAPFSCRCKSVLKERGCGKVPLGSEAFSRRVGV